MPELSVDPVATPLTPAAAAQPVERVGGHAGAATAPSLPRETGGPQGPEPTRFGDWEKAGRCIDF
jgi:hypothetical protein